MSQKSCLLDTSNISGDPTEIPRDQTLRHQESQECERVQWRWSSWGVGVQPEFQIPKTLFDQSLPSALKEFDTPPKETN